MPTGQLSFTGVDPVADARAARWPRVADERAVYPVFVDAVVVELQIVVERGEPPQPRERLQLVAGQGIVGERRCAPNNPPAAHVTLIEAEAVDDVIAALGPRFAARDTRRNILTRGVALNHLVGRTFFVGDVVLRGIELCDPCARLARFTSKAFERGLDNRGGLRAEVVVGGDIVAGATIRAGVEDAR
ncbi:MAG TPA: MOSC domain-containing protein [Myxococcota bacterium]